MKDPTNVSVSTAEGRKHSSPGQRPGFAGDLAGKGVMIEEPATTIRITQFTCPRVGPQISGLQGDGQKLFITRLVAGQESAMADPTPKVVEVTLSRKYAFMYENFVIATQNAIYLLLQKHDDVVDVLYFDSPQMKYGSPNDEARGGHPLCEHGLGFYGLFEVEHSPWIREQIVANRVHARHSDSMFDGQKHYIACFKDVMFEVTCGSFHEKQISMSEIETLIRDQLNYLDV